MSSILTKLPLALTAVAVGLTGYVSVSKLIPFTEASDNEIVEVSEFNQDANSGLDADVLAQDSQGLESGVNIQGEAASNSVSNTQSNNQNATDGMTLSELAKYNKAGACYVAYNSVVYNVSNNRSWSGCTHHGIRGGQDITNRFPHPTSYLRGIPVVGSLISTGTTPPNNGSINNPVSGDDDDHHDESGEYEYHDDDKYEDHDDDHDEYEDHYEDNGGEYEDD